MSDRCFTRVRFVYGGDRFLFMGERSLVCGEKGDGEMSALLRSLLCWKCDRILFGTEAIALMRGN